MGWGRGKRAHGSSRGSNWGRGQWVWLIVPIHDGEKVNQGPPTPPGRNPVFTSECSNIEKIILQHSICMYMYM